MEQGRCQRRVRPALGENLRKVLDRTGTAGGNDRHRDQVRDDAGELNVITGKRAIGVHAGQQDLTRAQLHTFLCPLDRVDAGRYPPAVDIHFPARSIAVGIDRQHDTLGTKAGRSFRKQLRPLDRGRIDADLIRTGEQEMTHIIHFTNAAADR